MNEIQLGVVVCIIAICITIIFVSSDWSFAFKESMNKINFTYKECIPVQCKCLCSEYNWPAYNNPIYQGNWSHWYNSTWNTTWPSLVWVNYDKIK
jgi:hypothetical protein